MARIIIADDDELVGEIARDALIAAGHGAGLVKDGAEALRVIKARRPDLVILDCNMPEISGVLLVQELRKMQEFADLPVMMLTGRRGERDEELARFAGANEYLKKPFDPDELVFRVEEMLAKAWAMARIIYVEDDELVGAVVQQILSKAGHIVGVIHHGTLAFDTIAFKKPDLVILDQSLPGMQGSDILKALRRLPALYLTPILMLSAKGSEAEIDAAMGAGANDYLVKPFEPDELVQRVTDVLRNNSFAASALGREQK